MTARQASWPKRREREEATRAKLREMYAKWEKNAENSPKNLELVQTWKSWTDVVEHDIGEHVVRELRRRSEEETESARRNESRGNPNTAARDRLMAILFRLAAEKLEQGQ